MSKHQQKQQERRSPWMPKYLRTPLCILAILFMGLFALAQTMSMFVVGGWFVAMAVAFILMAGMFWDKEL